jgi:Tol biopolymer transport system component
MKLASIILIFALLILIFLSGCEKSTAPKKDNTPPAAVTDLRIVTESETPVTLEWTAPGDDGSKGTAACYAIRYSTDSTILKQWDFALRVPNEPLPKPAGTMEKHTITDLPLDSTYYYAMKSQDEAGNWSAISNIASGFALAPGGISFVSNREGNSEIYVISSEGYYITNITNNEAYDYGPVWSYARKIAFMSLRDGAWNIYLADADGSNLQRLTFGPSTWEYIAPAFSPDGTRIAYEADSSTFCGAFYSDIYVSNIDGTDLKNLTENSGPADFNLCWSPDGNEIVFVSDRDGNDEIYVMNSDGTNHTRLTDNNGHDSHPVWSPDGREILFVSKRNGGWNIYVMNADGTDQRKLTSDNSSFCGIWSPDGSRIAYVSKSEQDIRLFVMNADGSNKNQLASNLPWPELAWSPMGSQIAFVGGELGAEEIMVIDVDGTNLRNISNHSARDLNPAWSTALTPSLWRTANPYPRISPQEQNDFNGWQLRSLCFTMIF